MLSALWFRFGLSLVLIVMWVNEQALANISSGKGSVAFDIDADGNFEMKLDATGLAVGSNLSPGEKLHVSGNGLLTGKVTVGAEVHALSDFNINGSISVSVVRVSSDTNLGNHSMVMADSSSGNLTLTLPDAQSVPGQFFKVKKISASNNVSILGGGNIEGFSGVNLSAGYMGYAKLVSSSGNWWLLSIRDGEMFHADLDPVLLLSENFEHPTISVWGSNGTDVSSDNMNITQYAASYLANYPSVGGPAEGTDPTGKLGAIRVRNGEGTVTTKAGKLPLVAGGYASLQIDYAILLEENADDSGANPYTVLEYSSDGTFGDLITLAEFDPVGAGGTYTYRKWYAGQSLTITDGLGGVVFSDTARVRFRSQSGARGKHTYLDDIFIYGVP